MPQPRRYHVYILSNVSRILYVGVTSDLAMRVTQHKRKLVPGFTAQYNVTQLVYFEEYPNPYLAISREKEIKGWLRARKIQLVSETNPTWKDLSEGEGFFLPR
ncbi:MAG TPA: GIY-YIG nuclease family protein [Longimicrobium sp.]|nr:GIY-YIG nuclease family protein [Longimicrobium sp.]